MREGEDSSMDTSLGLNISSDIDSSFQEVLIREKLEEKRENRCELTVLGRRDNGEVTPHKKVMKNNSGWWSIVNEVTSDNLTTKEDSSSKIKNKITIMNKCRNKDVECYKSIIIPIIKPFNITLLDEPDQKYNLSNSYEKMLGKIEKNKQNKEIKLFSMNKQTIFIKIMGEEIKKDRLHYCNEKSGVKKICCNFKNCIEIKMKTNFYQGKIELMKKDMNSMYAMDIFEGEGSFNISTNNINDILYKICIGSNPIQVQSQRRGKNTNQQRKEETTWV